MLDLEQYQLKGRTAREIATSAEALIASGQMENGAALPTVRSLAARLGTSPATVSAAYGILRRRGLVVAEGRRGTRVAPRPPLHAADFGPLPYASALAAGKRDLAIGLPDPALLPPLAPVLRSIDLESTLALRGLDEPDSALLEAAASAFAADGIPAHALAIMAGAFDAIERVLGAHLRPGDRVLIEDPAYTSIRDLIGALGLIAVPVAVDDRGPQPAAFADALRSGVQASVIVPRAQNPLGAALDEERVAALRALLARHPDVLLVEDDHAGAVAGVGCLTLISEERRRWAVIRSVSKTLHPDLRLALMAGDESTLARVRGRQALGPRWVSHILQATVAGLLADPDTERTTSRARTVYTRRRAAFIQALAERGVSAHGRSGLNVWVPVREEAPVLAALSDAGWLAMAGARFRLRTPPGIRVTIATLEEEEAAEVAAVIAGAERSSGAVSGY